MFDIVCCVVVLVDVISEDRRGSVLLWRAFVTCTKVVQSVKVMWCLVFVHKL